MPTAIVILGGLAIALILVDNFILDKRLPDDHPLRKVKVLPQPQTAEAYLRLARRAIAMLLVVGAFFVVLLVKGAAHEDRERIATIGTVLLVALAVSLWLIVRNRTRRLRDAFTDRDEWKRDLR